MTNSCPSVLLHVLLRAHLWTQDSWHCFLVHPEVFGHRMLGQIALAAETQGADYIHPLVCNLIVTAPRMHRAGKFAARSMCLLKAEQTLWPATSQDFLCVSLIWSWWLFCLVWEIFVFFFFLTDVFRDFKTGAWQHDSLPRVFVEGGWERDPGAGLALALVPRQRYCSCTIGKEIFALCLRGFIVSKLYIVP